MIHAVLTRNAENQWIGYSAKGHSGYAEAGHDIVCAAVSVLGAACFNSLESVCGIQAVLQSNEEGSLSYSLPDGLDEKSMHDAQILFGALHQGLQDVAEQYPKYIRVSIMIGGKRND